MSLATSPRLPSPPPFPEIQTVPESPAASAHNAAMSKIQTSRRIRPGTKAIDMAKGPALVPLSELNSPFQLQEYLKALHHKESHDEEGRTRAITRTAAVRLATPPEGVERSLWLYELCRLLIARVNILIVGFFNDTPKCSAVNCPEMRASEWQYLCAVHDPPKSCCAIDYCCHTLDWATNIITSQKHFPSRLTLGGDGGASQQGLRQLTNIFRRVYRMFAHAWFQHRDVFWQVEGTEGLYMFYKTVCEVYSLMPADTYTVPQEAEGMANMEEDQAAEEPPSQHELPLRPKVAREGTTIHVSDSNSNNPSGLSTPSTTKRHKHTPSTGSFVPPITEDDEDTEPGPSKDEDADAASILSTVRYDPKDVQPAASPAAEGGFLGDSIPEATVILDSTQLEEPSVTSRIHLPVADEVKSPVTPIEDEPSGAGETPTGEPLTDEHTLSKYSAGEDENTSLANTSETSALAKIIDPLIKNGEGAKLETTPDGLQTS